MIEDPITIFGFSYEGWGNHTPEFVPVVDAFRGRARLSSNYRDRPADSSVCTLERILWCCERLLGRYVWLQELGNQSTITGRRGIEIAEPLADPFAVLSGPTAYTAPGWELPVREVLPSGQPAERTSRRFRSQHRYDLESSIPGGSTP